MNIYTQSFQLLQCKELYNSIFHLLFKKYVTQVRICESHNGYEYAFTYQTFDSKYVFFNKLSVLNVYGYIKVENTSVFNDAMKDIVKHIKNAFEYNQKIALYIILDMEQDTVIYENIKNIVNGFGFKNDVMIIDTNAHIVWKKADGMIDVISARNTFLINEFNTKQKSEDMDLFKTEFSDLLTIMFKIMKTYM